ncbi:MAG: L-histidine N(alpha)-methyltransferase [Acidobacteriota bacterium]
MEKVCDGCLVVTEAQDERKIFKEEVKAGLSASPKTLPSRFFYDEQGSKLFQSITRLPEYYLTACELEILRRSGRDITSLVRQEEFNLVELGSGEGSKVIHLIEPALINNGRLTYLPIDQSISAMETLTATLSERYPSVEVRGIVAEYCTGLEWIKSHMAGPMLLLFLGSNLGNFSGKSAGIFLRRLRRTLAPGDLLVIGLDLNKDRETMVRAYNDAQGVTAQFNLNLLRRINRELSGNFNLSRFRHYSTFEPDTGGVESYLVSLARQSVLVSDLRRTFELDREEPIHTEHSHKYTEGEIQRLAQQAGFEIEADFYDSRRYFVDSVWRVPAK